MTLKLFKISSLIFLLIILINCSKNNKLFNKLPSKQTNIFFNNTIIENDTLNILNEEYVFNGGGVLAIDFNNDGLKDLFFSGNQETNKLYLNEGMNDFEWTPVFPDADPMRGRIVIGRGNQNPEYPSNFVLNSVSVKEKFSDDNNFDIKHKFET